MALGVGELGGKFQLIAVGVGKIDRDAGRAAVHLRAVDRDAELFELVERRLHLVGPDAEGEVEKARARVRRVLGVLQKEIEAVVPDLHQRVHRPPGALVLLVEAARAPDLAVENVPVKLHRALHIFHHERDVIDFWLHNPVLPFFMNPGPFDRLRANG
jgi:hypothetical protein